MDELRSVEAVSVYMKISRMRWINGRLRSQLSAVQAQSTTTCPDHKYYSVWDDDTVHTFYKCFHAKLPKEDHYFIKLPKDYATKDVIVYLASSVYFMEDVKELVKLSVTRTTQQLTKELIAELTLKETKHYHMEASKQCRQV